jgi:hypothetical protein
MLTHEHLLEESTVCIPIKVDAGARVLSAKTLQRLRTGARMWKDAFPCRYGLAGELKLSSNTCTTYTRPAVSPTATTRPPAPTASDVGDARSGKLPSRRPVRAHHSCSMRPPAVAIQSPLGLYAQYDPAAALSSSPSAYVGTGSIAYEPRTACDGTTRPFISRAQQARWCYQQHHRGAVERCRIRSSSNMNPQHVKMAEHVKREAVGRWRDVLESQRFPSAFTCS